MAIKVEALERFDKEFKRLKSKYPRVIEESEAFTRRLKDGERPGTKIPGVGYDVYKERLKNPDAREGKSGGFRVIYYVRLADRILLLTIYSKNEQSDIGADTIRRLIEEYVPTETDDNSIE